MSVEADSVIYLSSTQAIEQPALPNLCLYTEAPEAMPAHRTNRGDWQREGFGRRTRKYGREFGAQSWSQCNSSPAVSQENVYTLLRHMKAGQKIGCRRKLSVPPMSPFNLRELRP